MMHLHLQMIGWIFIILATIHIIFPRYFNWKIELAKLSLINREIMQVHTFFIALTVFGMGILCVSSAEELLTTSLGKKILLGLAVFWSIRMIMQFFVYSSALWRGKTFETIVHITFSACWTYISIIFWLSYLQ